MKCIIDDIRAFHKDYLQMVLVSVGLWVIGLVFVGACVAMGREKALVSLGTMMGLMGLMITIFFLSAKQFSQEFNLTVSMGTTRKTFFFGKLVCNILSFLLTMFILNLLNILELGILDSMFPEMQYEMVIHLEPDLQVMIFVAFAASVLSMGIGILFMKFGAKVYWMMWAVWMAGSIFGDKITQLIAPGRTGGGLDRIMQLAGSLNGMAWMMLGYGIIFVIGGCFAFGIRRQPVVL